MEAATLLNVIYLAGACCGVGGNWIAKWLKNEVACILDMARTEQKLTVYAISAQVVAAGLVVLSGAVEPNAPGVVFAGGVSMGWAIDACINKGKRATWTEEKRAEKVNPIGVKP